MIRKRADLDLNCRMECGNVLPMLDSLSGKKSYHSDLVIVSYLPVHPVEAYLTSLHSSLGAGTPETSGYPALSNLLNAVGNSLKPKITAVKHPIVSVSGDCSTTQPPTT